MVSEERKEDLKAETIDLINMIHDAKEQGKVSVSTMMMLLMDMLEADTKSDLQIAIEDIEAGARVERETLYKYTAQLLFLRDAPDALIAAFGDCYHHDTPDNHFARVCAIVSGV